MMVHIKPKTIDGRPSTISVEFMLTNLICEKRKSQYYWNGTHSSMLSIRISGLPVMKHHTMHMD